MDDLLLRRIGILFTTLGAITVGFFGFALLVSQLLPDDSGAPMGVLST